MSAGSRRGRRAGQEKDVLFRDDRIDPQRLTDEIRRLRRAGRRAALLDSGVFGMADLEWLAAERLVLLGSDASGRPGADLVRLGEDLRRGGGRGTYLLGGSWDGSGKGGPRPSFDDLLLMGRAGWDIHVSDRERERDADRLCDLARACREGGGLLVYYRTGRIEARLEDVAASGAWVHLSEDGLADESDVLRVRDAAAAAGRSGTGVVLHAPAARNVALLKDAVKAGALLVLGTPPSDYRSPLRELEALAAKAKLDRRAYYLDPSVLP
jgi:hypothetical protein